MNSFEISKKTARLVVLQRIEIANSLQKYFRKLFGRYIFTNIITKFFLSTQEVSNKYFKIMSDEFLKRGYNIISGGTDNHMMLIDLRNKNITGKDAEAILGTAEITVNKNMVPFDDKSPFVTSGIRVGTAAITTRGLKEEDMGVIVDFIDRAIINHNDLDSLHKIGSQVIDFMKKRPLFAC